MNVRLLTIKEVAKRTGLSTQLIRKWEERYEAVIPERMPNGYRGYTKADVETLCWLKQRVDDGVPIGMAVLEKRNGAVGKVKAAVLQPLGSTDPSDNLVTDWKGPVDRLLQCFEQVDLNGAQKLFEQLLSLHRVEHLLTRILEPALVELGERWERGEISEFQEHFGSHFIRDKMLSIRNLFQPSDTSPLIVTACGPGERHELGILFLGFFALQYGYRVIYLGTSPSEKGLLDCLRQMKPAAFTFSFSSNERLKKARPFLIELDRQISMLSPHTYVFIGGRIIEEDARMEGTSRVYMLGGDASGAINKIASRLAGRP
ncbi:MerR family transcriptional regulator [Paenibacillus spongiae]|uniref:Cobalamin B12-binding domain-containing protein n=1 Tax=Paenibacillus spongiae TaxID=2909671 RepID=A0ABY5S1V5_9BACL|nr:cobalamin B12-binding domain-containing protein [Paenibacillus spongiae]UVI27846.1 cobalamin B12-binding domain-containing protein [Paenibacillus spongiae]